MNSETTQHPHDGTVPLGVLLVNLVILTTRPRRSAQAYAKVWTEAGSPLDGHSAGLTP